jgi:hypothetical protein
VPHSVFTGRVIGDGEPQFLAEDTDAALALAEEEADTCGQCGMLRIWCSDPANQFAFDAEERVCWPTYRRELRLSLLRSEGRDEATARATQVGALFREGHEPDPTAGLELGDQETVTASAE